MQIATKTLANIDAAIEHDQGAAYRQWLEKVLPHIGDAYRGIEPPFRKHMGASGLGDPCSRAVWYGWHWTTPGHFSGRMLRLFNTGHMAEAKFIAMLLTIGVEVFQQDENGNQFRITDHWGHFGGSGDGYAYNVPDLSPDEKCLLEFKTVNDKGFKKYSKGVAEANLKYFVQIQIYMLKMGIKKTLFMIFNKNDEHLHAEIVELNERFAQSQMDRAKYIITSDNPPAKIHDSPGWYECRFCNHKDVCKHEADPAVNCRTCRYASPTDAGGGQWVCRGGNDVMPLSFEKQLEGCGEYQKKF